ncbi:hypothetical protein GCM10007971_18080 [Oceanobacillus indicireducens]|uniref:Uncharacterized protein n=1 Tax=Oceanobacillus indicireducens TaxID=1004261 RepID=A0A918D178_9BACI|nr:hypothetical protein GCM10007971_18080 [Oceanobacillus indicireducens]
MIEIPITKAIIIKNPAKVLARILLNFTFNIRFPSMLSIEHLIRWVSRSHCYN